VSILIFAANVLESAATVTVSPSASATRPITRLYDRIRTLYYEGGSAAQTDIDIHFAAAVPVTAIAFLNWNVTGVDVTVRADNTSPASTIRATIQAAGVDVIRSVEGNFTDWRVRIPSMASAPRIGELLLGVPRVIATNPGLDSAGKGVTGNVVRRKTPGGTIATTRTGPSATAFTWRWPYLNAADIATIQGAYAEANEGAKQVLIRDEDGVLYWLAWTTESIAPVPIIPSSIVGNEVYELTGMSFAGAG